LMPAQGATGTLIPLFARCWVRVSVRRRPLTSRVARAIERLHQSLPTPIHWAAAELIADDPRRPRPRGTRARFIRALRRAARVACAARPRFG